MLRNLIDFPVESDRLKWEAKEVLRDIGGRVCFFVRLRIEGTDFAQRALPPYVQVGKLRAAFTRIERDGLSVTGYFDRPVPEGPVEFGYGDEPPMLRCARRFEPPVVVRLDRALLPQQVANLEHFDVR